MKMRLLATTAITLAVATAAFAQSPTTQREKSATPPPAQSQQNPPASTSAPQAQTAPAQGTSTQNSTATGTSAPSSQSAGSTSPSGNSTSSQNNSGQKNTGQAPDRAFHLLPVNAAVGQSGTCEQWPGPAKPKRNGQYRHDRATAERPRQHCQSPGTNVNANASVNINDRDRSRISQSVARLDVRPLTNVNFSLSVGTVVPRDVRLSTLPADVVEIVPQYRGYSFVLVKDEIVIVEPTSYKIGRRLAVHGQLDGRSAFARAQQGVVHRSRPRRHSQACRTRSEGRTTGSAVRSEIRVGQRLRTAWKSRRSRTKFIASRRGCENIATSVVKIAPMWWSRASASSSKKSTDGFRKA